MLTLQSVPSFVKIILNVFCVGTDGHELFTNISRRGYYTVKATVVTGRESASTQTRVRYDPNQTACSTHLINRGVVLTSGGIATVQFTGVGPIDSFRCTLNGRTQAAPCERS